VKLADSSIQSYGGLTTCTDYHLIRKDESVVDSVFMHDKYASPGAAGDESAMVVFTGMLRLIVMPACDLFHAMSDSHINRLVCCTQSIASGHWLMTMMSSSVVLHKRGWGAMAAKIFCTYANKCNSVLGISRDGNVQCCGSS